MSSPARPVSLAARLCPRCGSSTSSPFAPSGVCLRCAGERVLAGESGVPFAPDPAFGVPDDRAGLPDRIGDYEIIEELGRGGMARIFAARQIGLGRIVAIKAIPAGRGAAADLELRFLRESQTIARLRHPHIVAVHDAGRDRGFVYFSMDYIEGGDLARRLREQPFAPREAAELLRKVASALAYTHGEGVLHRDLKPSNILLDGGEPRVADFGLAAQLEAGGDLTAGTGVLGTPHYVAPEVLRAGSAAFTVASDVYALGVVMFELLTGRTPFAGATPAALAGLVDQSDLPAPRLLAPAAPRDLETICLHCLERDPAARYAGAAAVAEDLRRFLADEPIVAQPPGRRARFVKFVRRHRAAFAVAVAVAVLLPAGTALSTWEAVRARRAEKSAAMEAAVSREVRAFLENDLLAQASPDRQPNRDLPLRAVLDRAAQKIDGRFANQPLVEASLRETLAATYESLGEAASEQHQIERALGLRRAALGADDLSTFPLLDRLGLALAGQGRLKDADPIAREAVARAERVLGREHPVTLHAMNDLIYTLKAQGKLAEAEAVARQTLDRARGALGPDDAETRDAMSNLASVLFSARKLEESETLNVQALAASERVLGPEHPDTLAMMSNLASVYWAEDKLADAERINLRLLEIRTRVLGPEHPETLRSINNLATTYDNEGKFAEAAALHEKNRELRRRVLGPEHADTLSTTMNLAMVDQELGRLDEAAALAAPTLATARRVLGPDHFATLAMMLGAGRIELAAGHLAAAEALVAEALAARLRLSGPENSQTLLCLDTLGEVYLREGKFAEAQAALVRSVAGRTKTMPVHWRTQVTRSLLGAALAGQHRPAEAEPLLMESFTALAGEAGSIPAANRSVIAQAGERLAQFYRDTDRGEAAAAVLAKLAR